MKRRSTGAGVFLLLLWVAGGAGANSIYVSTAVGNDGNSGASWAQAKATVQAGLAIANPGDQVCVGMGTYANVALTVPAGVSLLGGFDPSTGNRNATTNTTVLAGDATDPVVSLVNSTTATPQMVDGFAITGGNGGIAGQVVVATISNNLITANSQNRAVPGFVFDGGGISIEDVQSALIPTTQNIGNVQVSILNNTVTNNATGGWGGGIAVTCGTAVISGNQVTGNTATTYSYGGLGGGVDISYSAAQLSNDEIDSNVTTDFAGGLVSYASTTTVSHCGIKNNTSPQNGAGMVSWFSNDTVTDCQVSGNTGPTFCFGGGIWAIQTTMTVDRCRFVGNRASNNSAGIEFDGSGSVTNCLFDSNYAGLYSGGVSVYTNGNVSVVGNTFVNNQSGLGTAAIAVYSDFRGIISHPLIANNICAFGDSDMDETPGSGSVSRNNCLFSNDNTPDTVANSSGDIVANPQFLNAAGGDYRLSIGSPCIDAGADSYVSTSLDLGLTPRIQGSHVDIGALEFDQIPPTSSSTVSPPTPAAGWYNVPVTVSIDGVDNPGGVGVASISYSQSGAQPLAWTTVSGNSASTTISSEGVTTVNYYATDANGNSESPPNSRTVNIDLTPPIANGQSISTPKSTPVAITLTGSDALSGVASIAVATQPAHGALGGTSPNLFYTPVQGYIGSDSFNFVVTDNAGNKATATISITVTNTKQSGSAPIAIADSYSTLNHTPVALNVLANDSPSLGAPASSLVVLGYTQPTNGVVVLNNSGTGTYTPTGNFSGHDQFTYTITDANGGVATTTVTVKVAVNGNPVAVPDRATASASSPARTRP